MPLIQESHDSLPYIDPDITPQERSRITTLLSSDLPPDHSTTLHPSIPDLAPSLFPPLVEAELSSVASGQPLEGGIDTARYEALEPPTTAPTSDEDRPAVLEEWRTALQQAYVSSTHLQNRVTNLSLLSQFGKNAWLIGNAQLEDILRTLEQELVETRGQTDEVNRQRKAAQESRRGEMEALEQSWQSGVGRVIETEVAAEKLRQEILDKRRQGL
ncbi:MAG: hypothetical protein M1817_004343 [Caeruleum heppii]|nr:MAG: hypothetical protein M1817_004343 [Caeruleum heppii]